ncbi:MAG: alpha-galactosidase [Treponema sp.]|jgi:alpha-galactosidase|nr:alpha-galactosidase [Treponema sp.]
MDFPVCHLDLTVVEDKKSFLYKAEGEAYINVRFDTTEEIGYKRFSDGDIMPAPFLQQLVFTTEKSARVIIEFTPLDAVVMRKDKIAPGKAILSQNGKPLIYGVNGIYDLDSDTLITWHGFKWHFRGDAVTRQNGRDYICVEGEVLEQGVAYLNVYFRYYQDHLGFKFHNPRHRRFNPASICGWATWEAFHKDINLEKIETASAFLADKLKPWGLQYIQVDDGYQTQLMPGEGIASIKEGWLKTNEKFPGGHEGIISAIIKHGLSPAIWTNAAISNTQYARESGRCIIVKENPLKGPWIDYVYDCKDESLEEIYELYKELGAKGYRYFKVDALRHLIYDGLMLAVREGFLSNDEAIVRFRAYMEAVRRGIGEENYLLSCWGVLTPNTGLADAMRIATDASDSNESLLLQINEAARWHFTHGVLYRNDIDYICMRMETPHAKTLASLVSLNGYLYFISDDTELYTQEKLKVIRKTMPPTGSISAEAVTLDADSPMNKYRNMVILHKDIPSLVHGSLWANHFYQSGRSWTVIQILRPSPSTEEQILNIPLEDLNLDPLQTYAGFDFWEQKPIGLIKEKLSISPPEPFQNRIIALTQIKNSIELIGSSRHVSMDVISVKYINRRDSSLTLCLEGIPGESIDYWFTLNGATKLKIECTGGSITSSIQESFLKCTVSFEHKDAELKIFL